MFSEIVAAHPGLARNAGGDHDDVRVRRVFVVIGAGDVGIALLDGHGFEQIQTFALRHAFDDVDQNDIRQFFGRDPVGSGRSYVAGTYDGHFLSHE